jgi:hypothetical protein
MDMGRNGSRVLYGPINHSTTIVQRPISIASRRLPHTLSLLTRATVQNCFTFLSLGRMSARKARSSSVAWRSTLIWTSLAAGRQWKVVVNEERCEQGAERSETTGGEGRGGEGRWRRRSKRGGGGRRTEGGDSCSRRCHPSYHSWHSIADTVDSFLVPSILRFRDALEHRNGTVPPWSSLPPTLQDPTTQSQTQFTSIVHPSLKLTVGDRSRKLLRKLCSSAYVQANTSSAQQHQ